MAILGKDELLNYSGETRYFSVNESLKELKRDNPKKIVSVFLSHKHSEARELEATIRFLKSFGIEIYVDWLDEEMPKTTSGETAKKLKKKIESNEKFILLATEGAISSKWCNWELGIGDVHKFDDDIAVFPIKNYGSSYTGSEYLQIYPYIEKINGTYYVVKPTGERERLKLWLLGINKFLKS